jgi:hypothetical protein
LRAGCVRKTNSYADEDYTGNALRHCCSQCVLYLEEVMCKPVAISSICTHVCDCSRHSVCVVLLENVLAFEFM